MIFTAKGILEYGPGIRVVLRLDKEIGKYYKSLLPAYIYAKGQRYASHITVVRTRIEVPTNMEFWERYVGEEVECTYSGEIEYQYPYFYLNAWSERLGEIRKELGLPEYRAGEISKTSYHITIANIKDPIEEEIYKEKINNAAFQGQRKEFKFNI